MCLGRLLGPTPTSHCSWIDRGVHQAATRPSRANSDPLLDCANLHHFRDRPWIHPGYRGCLTLEIASVSNTSVCLHPGTPIGQLLLLTVDLTDEEKQKPDTLTGSYIGPAFPEAPTFKHLAGSCRGSGRKVPRFRLFQNDRTIYAPAEGVSQPNCSFASPKDYICMTSVDILS